MAPRPRFLKLPNEKRELILTAAATEFAAHGFSTASYNRIIAEAGVSKGAMYYYFDDKKDLFRTTLSTLVQEVFDDFSAFPEVQGVEEFWEEMNNVGRIGMELWAAHPELAGLLYATEELRKAGEWSEADETVLVDQGMKWFDHIIETGVGVGAIRTDLPDGFLREILWKVGEAQDLWFARHAKEYSNEELTKIMLKYMRLWRRICEPEEEA